MIIFKYNPSGRLLLIEPKSVAGAICARRVANGSQQRANLEAVEGRLWWVDDEVAQSEAEALRVLLEVNGSWALPGHTLHLSRGQRPTSVLHGRHHAISPPFSLL